MVAFSLLGTGQQWLEVPPHRWSDDPGYNSMKSVTEDLAVLNDTATRGVKDIPDYANTANIGDYRGVQLTSD